VDEHTRAIKKQSLMLLVRDGQEDAIVHGDRMREESGGVSARDGDSRRITAESGTRGFCRGSNPVARLERNAGGLWSAIRGSETGIADENLAVAAVAARGNL